MRYGLLGLVLLLLAPPAAWGCNIIMPLSITRQTAQSDIVLVGTATSIECEHDEVATHADAPGTISYTLAIVKIETAIRGAKNVTHVRVGFVMRSEVRGRGQRGPDLNLAENGRYLLFLQKHPVGNFYVFQPHMPPLPITDFDNRAPAIAEATCAAGAIADPMKALQAESAQDRALAAMVLLTHYRQPEGDGRFARELIDAGVNAAILQAIAGADWTVPLTVDWSASLAIQFLGMTEADGWKYPGVQPRENRELVYQKAFQGWLAGPGATFRFQKYVVKVKK